jgi:hypothetical protein
MKRVIWACVSGALVAVTFAGNPSQAGELGDLWWRPRDKTEAIPTIAPWTRAFNEASESTLVIPLDISVEYLKQEIVKGLRDPLAHDTKRVKLRHTFDEIHRKLVDCILTQKVPVLVPKFKEIKIKIPRPWPFKDEERTIKIPDGFGTIWVERPVPGKKWVEVTVKSSFEFQADLRYKVTLNKDAISLAVKGNSLCAQFELSYWVESSVVKAGPMPVMPPTPGRAEGKIQVTMSRSTQWDQGKLVLKGGTGSIRWIPSRSLTSVPPIDLATIIKGNVLLEALSHAGVVNGVIQDNLSSPLLDLNPMLAKMCKPHKVDDDIFFSLRPKEVVPFNVTTAGRTVSSGLLIKCKPRLIVLQRGEKEPPTSPLPVIQSARARPANISSKIDVEYRLSHKWVGEQLSRMLAKEGVAGLLERGLKWRAGSVVLGSPNLQPAGDASAMDGKAAKGRVRMELPMTKPIPVRLGVAGVLCSDESNVWLEHVCCEFHSDLPLVLRVPQIQKGIALAKAAIATGLNNRRWELGKEIKKHIAKPLNFDAGPLTLQVTLVEAKLKDCFLTEKQIKVVLSVDATVACKSK